MSKEKVFIVVSHKHTPKAGSKPSNKQRQVEWEVAESVEFVNQLRNRHHTTSSAIGDYINKKMIAGARHGMGDYDKFERYVRTKYEKQMAELDAAYRTQQVQPEVVDNGPELFTDQFGNIRARTVFDHA